MENAKVGIFEDLEAFRTIAGRTLEILGHTILINSATIEEAKQEIENLEEELDVALVDGNLDINRPTTGPDEETKDGKEIAALLRDKFGDRITIVSISSTGEAFEGTDIHFNKTDTRRISEYIDSLPDKT